MQIIPFGKIDFQGSTLTNVGSLTLSDGTTVQATAGTIVILTGKTATINNTLTFAGTDGTTMTFPATSATVATLGLSETFTGVKTFGSAGAVGRLKIAGTTSGAATIDAPAVAGSIVITLPSTTSTLATTAQITFSAILTAASVVPVADGTYNFSATSGNVAVMNIVSGIITTIGLAA